MNDWMWFSLDLVFAIHHEQLRDHGGAEGLRDRGLLESALARPQQLAAYGEPDLFALAAAYAFGIAKNHPFVDGNKRTAFVLAETFVRLNGKWLTATDADCLITTLKLAAGDISEAEFAEWLRANSGD